MNAGQMSYTLVARALHWAIAVLVIVNIVIGLFHEGLQPVLAAIPIHKAIGITVLGLTALRMGWRAGHRPPPLPMAMPRWEQGLAHALHGLFYALLLILPLSGWVMVSAGDKPLRWFGLFAIPKFAVAKGDAMVGIAHAAHGAMGLVFGALVLLHVAAALRHQLILKDGVLRRMLG